MLEQKMLAVSLSAGKLAATPPIIDRPPPHYRSLSK